MDRHTIRNGYTAILSDQPYDRPSVIVVCRNEDALAWEAHWATEAVAGELPITIRKEALVDEAQIAALEHTGAAFLSCILPLAMQTRDALEDARRAVLGLPELSRGAAAWWRTGPDGPCPPYLAIALINAHPISHASVRACAPDVYSFFTTDHAHLFQN